MDLSHDIDIVTQRSVSPVIKCYECLEGMFKKTKSKECAVYGLTQRSCFRIYGQGIGKYYIKGFTQVDSHNHPSQLGPDEWLQTAQAGSATAK